MAARTILMLDLRLMRIVSNGSALQVITPIPAAHDKLRFEMN